MSTLGGLASLFANRADASEIVHASSCGAGPWLVWPIRNTGVADPEHRPRPQEHLADTEITDEDAVARVQIAQPVAVEARARRAAEERARGEAQVPALWDALDRSHRCRRCGTRSIGATSEASAYLTGRGLDLAELRQRGDVVRFYRDGSPAVLIHDLETGAPINVIRRQIDREPKILSLDLGDVLGTDDATGTFSTLCAAGASRVKHATTAAQQCPSIKGRDSRPTCSLRTPRARP
jgi:hypothetical protein